MKHLSRALVFLGLTSYLSISSAIPIFTTQTNDSGVYTVTVVDDGTGTNSGIDQDLAGLRVYNIVEAANPAANPNDRGILYADYFLVTDSNSDGELQFSFTNIDDISELTGVALYNDERQAGFTSPLAPPTIAPPPVVPVNPPPVVTPPTKPIPSVPEPSTFLLLGVGLLAAGAMRFFKAAS
jgi:hypothetical protein